MKFAREIGIAGAGLVGRLLAWRLSASGHRVTLFEAGSLDCPTGACHAAAGMISPFAELYHSPLTIHELGMRSMQLWPTWVQQLEQQTGSSLDYRSAGSILVAHPQDNTELRQFRRELYAKLRGENEAHIKWLHRADLLSLEPDLDRFDGGLYLAGEADIDNRKLLPALQHAIRMQNVTVRENTAVQCEHGAIQSSRGRECFDLVIDTRGLGARQQIKGLRAVRGEVMVVETPEVRFSRPVRLLHPRYQLYAVPRGGDCTVIGATEIESEDLSPISLRSTMELSSALYSIHPAFAEARVIETRVNGRPATMNNLPVVENTPGLIRINGLYRHGYLVAPALVQQVVMQINEMQTSSSPFMTQVT